ncbi:transglutaminase-like domain-containing protein [uncultured Jannaschia sp.]|uniref:transglutaminase-like domain-containing protein n=1 Tax=uncultured Jannaschia sp. TaxID=293347 RepID=UPI002605973B|nr:transglutaminase-like domain-containing protein [uncultured Jannaschia sp.]
MSLTRRTLLATASAAAALPLLPRRAAASYAPTPGPWRRFEITTRIAIDTGGAPAQAWVPVPAVFAPDWAKPGQSRWTTNAAEARLLSDDNDARFVHAVWEGNDRAVIDIVSEASVRDRATDFAAAETHASLAPEARAHWTAPTSLIPTDGIVRETSDRITAGIEGDEARARAIYDWIVEETARNPETRGCGLGDVGSMLQVGDLTGKCADLNALFVGLARAAGLPARDVYGLRVAPSAFGYKSLGAGSEDVTKAQHCRADVWLEEHGWVAADPADVRKVMLEEPPKNLALDDPKVVDVRAALFGAWEGNWLPYNFAHDVVLPGSENGPVPFLMYPQAEVAGRRLDPLEPSDFAYTITAREIEG